MSESVEPKAVAASPPPGKTDDTPFISDDERMKDMDDAFVLTLGWPPSQRLRAALDYCQQQLKPSYDRANEEALRYQRRHRRITIGAAVAGGVAVIVALVQPTPLQHYFKPSLALAVYEAILAALALLSVLLGVKAAFHSHWLLERHKAERFRLLKFSALFEPLLLAAQGTDIAAWRAWLDEQIARINGLQAKHADGAHAETMEDWIEAEPRFEVPRRWQNVAVSHAELFDLASYFKVKRFDVQCKFFSDRAKRNVQWDRTTRWVPLFAFYGSVTAALLHFTLDAGEYIHKHYFQQEAAHQLANAAASEAAAQGGPPHWWGLIFVAALLPIIGATMRTIRSANEFSRHMIRYRAKLIGLTQHAETVKQDAQQLKPGAPELVPSAAAEQLLLELWGSEQIMASEHREWLRLMIEAEWFG